jgi:hypothetical protein
MNNQQEKKQVEATEFAELFNGVDRICQLYLSAGLQQYCVSSP